MCPNTGELPVDPVTAEDGKIYERAAIAEWLSKKMSSPITNLAMGARLFPATQVKNMIEQLVNSGSVEAEKVAAVGRMEIDLECASVFVRAFYRLWMLHPYLENGKFAAAVALSMACVERAMRPTRRWRSHRQRQPARS